MANSDEDQFTYWFFNWSAGQDDGRGAFFICFHMMLGEFADQIPFFKDSNAVLSQYHRWTAMTLFILFLIFICLVLLNLLVAIMGESYNRIIEDGVVDDWCYEQAGVVLNIEASLSDRQPRNPKYFPKWIHVLEPAHVKPYEESDDYKMQQLEELLKNVKELLQYKHQKNVDMNSALTANLTLINGETEKVKHMQRNIL